MFITPRYAQNHATFISTLATFNDTGIYFGAGRGGQRLLEVPLIPAGRFTRNDSIAIQITAVLNGGMLNQRDRDPDVGVTDGNMINMFRIHDINNYPRYFPCIPLSASGTLSKTFSTGPVPGPRPAPRHLLYGKRLGPRPSPSSLSLAARQVTRSQALAQLPVTCCTASDWVPGPCPAPRHLLYGKRLGPRPSPSSPSLAAKQVTGSQALAQLPVTCCMASDSVPGPRPAPRCLLYSKRLSPRHSPSSPTLAVRQVTGSWVRAWE